MNTIFVHLTFRIKVSTYFQTPMAGLGYIIMNEHNETGLNDRF